MPFSHGGGKEGQQTIFASLVSLQGILTFSQQIIFCFASEQINTAFILCGLFCRERKKNKKKNQAAGSKPGFFFPPFSAWLAPMAMKCPYISWKT